VILIPLIFMAIAGVLAFNVGKNFEKRAAETQFGSAQQKARKVVDDAIKEAESIKRDAR
jgi:ribonuclease Y